MIGSNQNEISSDRILGAAVVTLSRVMHRYPVSAACPESGTCRHPHKSPNESIPSASGSGSVSAVVCGMDEQQMAACGRRQKQSVIVRI